MILLLILISIIIIAYNLIEDLNSLRPITEQQYRFWNSIHVVIRKLLHFALEKLLQFALKDYYILRWKFYYILRQCYYILSWYYILRRFLLHFALILHFAAIITFCGVTVLEDKKIEVWTGCTLFLKACQSLPAVSQRDKGRLNT